MTKANGHIFISYAREDRGRVAVLVQLFEEEGWSVWWDRENLPVGRKFDQVIDQAIQDASCVLVCWSGAAIDSDWVLDEANEAKGQDKLIPVYLETVKLPYGHRGYHCLDLSEWDNQATHEAYQRLKTELSQKQPRLKSVKPLQTADTTTSDHSKGIPPQTQTLLDGLTSLSIDPQERLAAGDELARLGDPRPGVGLDADGVPDIDWVEIPGGEFLFGENKDPLIIESFNMARYPITNAQYDAFINDGGYSNKRWWEGLSEIIDKPEDPSWNESNRPGETVSWYEAIAFCRWLSDRQGYDVTLPTDQQWERVARGTDGREYPWGDEYQPGYANINETRPKAGPNYLGQTSAVGMYNFAGSPEGIQDLSGNVWEWVLNEYENPEITSVKGKEPRVLRGGSWFDGPDLARASFRLGRNPGTRDLDLGFRVVCSSPIAR